MCWDLYIFSQVICSCLQARATVVGVTILSGTNDSVLMLFYQHVPFDEQAENFARRIGFVRSLNVTTICIISQQASEPDRTLDILARYDNACKSIAPLK